MSVPPEAALVAALGASPAPVVLWWRDDDAGRDHPRLASLLALAERRRAPVALAVVPEWLEEACAARILGCPLATVLQHGIAHADHAVPPGKKIELGGSADHAALARDLVRGRERLAAAFGARVSEAPELMHGLTSEVFHDGDALFAGIPSPFLATRYHSLAVEPGTLPAALRVTARNE